MHPLAGKPAPKSILADIPALVSAYYTLHPDPEDPRGLVSFGTSGHRGRAFDGTFNEDHILAVVQAICLHRRQAGITGPLFLGKDTHALSEPAQNSALEVLAANGVETMAAPSGAFTPTPAVSHAILGWNRGRTRDLADGIVITPSHNPPDNGGIKYNPPDGGPADTDITDWVARAGQRAAQGRQPRGQRACPSRAPCGPPASTPSTTSPPTWRRWARSSTWTPSAPPGLRLGADALGGAGLGYWEPIARRYGLQIEVLQRPLRPHLRFHVRGQGRQDPHGLLLAPGHGRAGGAQGPLRHRLRQRPRLRPPRHRLPQRRPDEPQPLPGGGHRYLFRHPAPGARTPPSARPW